MTENLYFRNKAFIFVTITSWKKEFRSYEQRPEFFFFMFHIHPIKTGEKLWLLLI